MMENFIESLYKENSLTLPKRKKIWMLFGEVCKNGKYAKKSESLIKRVQLSLSCINYTEKVWKVNDIINISFLYDSIMDYIENKLEADELNDICLKYQNKIENLSSDECTEEYQIVAMACCYAARVALFDEILLYDTDDDDLDEELDAYSWDTAYLISLLFSNQIIKYWEWYILQAEKLL